MDNHNYNCDGAHCTTPTGEVRRLPTDAGSSSAVILCFSCFRHEMSWRRERNRKLTAAAQFPIVHWTDLQVYEGCKNEN